MSESLRAWLFGSLCLFVGCTGSSSCAGAKENTREQGHPRDQVAAPDSVPAAASGERPPALSEGDPLRPGSVAPKPTGPESVGVGDIREPALGPGPTEAARVTGAPFVLVKNWNFGSAGTIRSTQELMSEFEFHDQFDTIANGTKYGSVTVAPTPETAIFVARELGLPDNKQPVEDPLRPNREFKSDVLVAHVRPLSATATKVSVKAHDTGNGSFMAKWKLPSGGSGLGKDLLWETRARIPKPLLGYWFAIWTAGNRWDKGAEMDVVESFGVPHLAPGAKCFHVNSVGGDDNEEFDNWPRGLTKAGVPERKWDLSQWHTWTWVYLRDDTYRVYYDGHLVQHGKLYWTFGAKPNGPPIDMRFLFDFSWGHTEISDVNISLPASSFPLTYEIDYSRVYLR
ncbi:MAG TPA: hypothetical protein VFG30_44575 [Polyangiales bacterium]|nr:hypothetical protein [Polyangiales bacterium]